MSGFYKMDPSDWDYGTAELSLEQEAAYLRIVNAIHKHDAPVPNIDRVLAGMFRCSTRKARALVKALLDAGKVTIEDGKIWNERARSDMVQRQFVSSSAAVRGSKGGRTRAENAAKARKTKQTPQATASSRIEENRIEEKRDTNVSPKKTPKEPDGFPEFWAVVPRKVAKGNARKAYATALRKTDSATLFSAMKAYAEIRQGQDEQYTVHPTTWLNAERWTDAPPQIPTLTQIPGGRYEPSSKSQERVQAFVSGARGAP